MRPRRRQEHLRIKTSKTLYCVKKSKLVNSKHSTLLLCKRKSSEHYTIYSMWAGEAQPEFSSSTLAITSSVASGKFLSLPRTAGSGTWGTQTRCGIAVQKLTNTVHQPQGSGTVIYSFQDTEVEQQEHQAAQACCRRCLIGLQLNVTTEKKTESQNVDWDPDSQKRQTKSSFSWGKKGVDLREESSARQFWARVQYGRGEGRPSIGQS